ncbi:Ig-like domain-containing protein [Nocardioides sp. SR21]|uniref:Ig-like domain-containing protein n=1 Tax=Nocardioides sp. SR21 TaxID=2919501 RepID=UPI001FAA5CF7|nr:Ig-like domain-containing protein [Nocardioides sp. SR21]
MWDRLCACLGAAALLIVGVPVVVATPASAADAWVTPSHVRSIGGTGRASLFPWGMAWNPVADSWVVTDYFNYQVREYDADWTYARTLPQPSAATGDPESVLASVAVDPRNGDVYVGKPKPDTLAHYDAAGNRLPDVVVDPGSDAQTYTAWLSIDDQGYIYILDSHLWNTAANPSRLIKLAPGGGSQVAAWDLTFPNQQPGQFYGIDVGQDGRIYVSDSINRRVLVLDPDGHLVRTIGLSGDVSVVGGLSGDLRSVLVDDEHGRLYVVDALQNQVEVFGLDGTPLFHFGGEGTAPGQLIAPRQLAMGPDGTLWTTEYGNYRVQEFDPATGASLDIQPSPLPERPAGQLGQPRDVAVDPATGDVWVADSWNQRFCRYAADGAHEGCWGGRGNTPPYGVKYPRGIGFDPVNRRVWVANNAGGTIYVYDDQANFLFQVGNEDNRRNSVPGMFEKPFAIAFGNGYAYVTDVGSTYTGNTVQVKILDAATGTQVGTITGRNSKSVAVDPATGQVFVADANAGQQKIYVYGPTGGTALRSFGGKGTANGKFTGLWGVTVVNGVVYATDEAQSRVQAFTTTGTFLGKWGGAGSGPYQLRNPSGISHDSTGRLYVADSSNDRISVFDPAVAKPAYLFGRPTLTITSPATPGSTTDAPMVVSGRATDDRGLSTVEISVRDESTGLWWDPATATWTSAQTWGFAPWWGTPTTARWSWTFPGPQYGRTYHVEARARDADNTVSSPVRAVDVRVDRPDGAPPETVLEAPLDGSTAPVGRVDLSGTATDDRGIATVRWSVRHAFSGQYWGGTGWVAEEILLPGSPVAPGTTSTSWSSSWTPPSAGTYVFSAQAVDSRGNVDPTPATTTVTLTIPGGDVTAPNATISTPRGGQSVPLGATTITGRASDDSGIRAVDVAIQDIATGLWWNDVTQTWGPFTWMNGDATPATRMASPTTWSTTWSADHAGSFRVGARARDVGGIADPTPAWTSFTVG